MKLLWPRVSACCFASAMAIVILSERHPRVEFRGQDPGRGTSGRMYVGQDLRHRPVRFEPRRDGSPGLTVDRLDLLLGKVVPPADQFIPSDILHLVRLHGLDRPIPQAGMLLPGAVTGRDLLPLLSDDALSARAFGGPVLVRTRQGVRYPTATSLPNERYPRARETHRDQVLAGFAEAGIPLDYPLQVKGEDCRLGDVLRNSVADFRLDQRELEWTTIAYAAYLLPCASWRNRFGQAFTFDDLAGELIRRGLSGASCYGIHRLYALLFLARVDLEIQPILGGRARGQVVETVNSYVKTALENQWPDGSWPGNWHPDVRVSEPGVWSPDYASDKERLLATGHLAELMLYLPGPWKVSEEVILKSAAWLRGRLEIIPDDVIRRSVCPHTHAACVIKFCSQ
jgi:hypothetical protein